jgi:hypothetical protein
MEVMLQGLLGGDYESARAGHLTWLWTPIQKNAQPPQIGILLPSGNSENMLIA